MLAENRKHFAMMLFVAALLATLWTAATLYAQPVRYGPGEKGARFDSNRPGPPDPEEMADRMMDHMQLAEDDPLRILMGGLMKFHFNERKMEMCRERQMDLMRKAREQYQEGGRGGPPSLPDIPARRKMRDLIKELHGLQDAQDQAVQEQEEVAKEIAENAAAIRSRLEETREKWVKENDSPEKTSFGFSMASRFDPLISVLEEAEANPDQSTQIVLEGLRELAEKRRMEHSSRFSVRRLWEKLDKLERESRFLKQRLEANDQELQSLRSELERLTELEKQKSEKESDLKEKKDHPLL